MVALGSTGSVPRQRWRMIAHRLRAGRVGKLGERVLDALIPPQCLSCRAPVDRQGSVCAACWRAIDFIEPPVCAACGFPFEVDAGDGALCGSCLGSLPAYGRARAVMRYDDHSRRLVLGFKHGDRTEAAMPFARWMLRAGRVLLDDADLIVPVPLYRLRLFARRYNQAALLAHALGKLGDLAVAPDSLSRRRATPAQAGLNATERAANVRGAFAVNGGKKALVRGKRIVLIDDVMTTGSTVNSCATALLRAGAGAVDVLTLARVAKPKAHHI